MRYMVEKDFDECTRLFDEHIKLNKEWLNQVKRHYNGEITYEETRPQFEASIEAYNKWLKCVK